MLFETAFVMAITVLSTLTLKTSTFGTIIVEFVCMLVRHGYLISVFNTSIISKVMHLDPFNYIRSGKEMEFADE